MKAIELDIVEVKISLMQKATSHLANNGTMIDGGVFQQVYA